MRMAISTITIERAGVSAGAIATGVDVGSLGDDEFAVLRQAFLDHHVLCIRGSSITPEQQLEFAARWGDVYVHPYVPSIEGYPGIMLIHQVHPITETWHADTTHSYAPPSVTMLLARTVPPVGGDTAFASQHLAYETLSPGIRATLDQLFAVHYGTDLAKGAGLDQLQVTHAHPVVMEHPETGRRGLFVNGDYVRHFEGWTPSESAGLLRFLYEHASRLELTYRHHWLPGDLVLWDNRSVQHRVIADHGRADRKLHRVTLLGAPLHGPAGETHLVDPATLATGAAPGAY
jgi:taurine dioxygenase